jgi:hypothetical protein
VFSAVHRQAGAHALLPIAARAFNFLSFHLQIKREELAGKSFDFFMKQE